MVEIFDGLNNVLCSSEEAGSSSADLQVVLAHSGSVEHGVEGGDLIHLHGSHLQNLGSLVHRRQSQKVVVLLLSDEQHGNTRRRLVIVRELIQQNVNGLVRFFSELKWSLVQVIFSVSMVGKGGKGLDSLRCSG